jgi:WD40 repeat protein
MTTLSKMTTKSDSILQKISEFSGHSSGIYSLIVHDEKIYSASADGFIARWNSKTGLQDKFAINIGKPVYALLISGNYLWAGTNAGDIYVFDLEQRIEIKHFIQHHTGIFSIIENPQMNVVYSADSDGNVAVWDALTLVLHLFLPLGCGKIRRMSVSPEGDFLAVGGQDGYVRVFDTQYYNEVSSFYAHQDGVSAILFHPNKKNEMYSGGKDAIIRLWDWQSGSRLKEIPAHNFVVYDLVYLNDLKIVVSASRDKTMKIWSEELQFMERIDQRSGGHRHSVNTLAKFSDDQFISGSDDKRIVSWRILKEEN